ncbi:MAG TPA: hypothetical protein VMT69_09985 [Kineosporiaceae bacterium]|nr:hypothetical protein [Kineosporiaceae bacterium]
MDAGLLAVLNDAERLLVAQTEPAPLADLDEDAVVALHTRVRRARSKSVSQYRRSAAARVQEQGGRGLARPKNTRARQKAEVFEEALARVSTRLGELAARAAAELKAERLAMAQAAKGPGPTVSGVPEQPTQARSVTAGRTGDRELRSPASEKRRAATTSAGARRQARRDSRS